MKHEKFLYAILIQLMCLTEYCFPNSTQIIFTEEDEASTTNNTTTTPNPLINSSDVTVSVKNAKNQVELLEIFQGVLNVTRNVATNHPNVSAVTENVTGVDVRNNTTFDNPSTVLSWNDTIKTNYTVTSEAIASQENSSFALESTGAIAAGVFLVSAVVGYFSCVGYRRFMQKKYGNSQILVGEDVYDTSDLRYFEI